MFQYFDVCHVDSATIYRVHFFSNQLEAGLAGFENLNTQPPESIDHLYLGSTNGPYHLPPCLYIS